jgi:hypothetical protein
MGPGGFAVNFAASTTRLCQTLPSSQHDGFFCTGHWMQILLKIDIRKLVVVVDIRNGYFQIFMYLDDMTKTAIITPFCLRNAGSTFQRMLDRLLDGLPFIFVYLEDIIGASKSLEQYEKIVE